MTVWPAPRGLVIGCILSLPLWAAIVWFVRWLW